MGRAYSGVLAASAGTATVRSVGRINLANRQRIGFPPGMTDSIAFEFPFVEELPKREKSKLRKVWDELEALRQVSAEKGQLLPVQFVSELASVSRQRVHELMTEGRLERVEVNGRPFVTESSLLAWVKTERKTGRPPKVPRNDREAAAAAWRYGKAVAAEVLKKS